jgi:hypothetical protein
MPCLTIADYGKAEKAKQEAEERERDHVESQIVHRIPLTVRFGTPAWEMAYAKAKADYLEASKPAPPLSPEEVYQRRLAFAEHQEKKHLVDCEIARLLDEDQAPTRVLPSLPPGPPARGYAMNADGTLAPFTLASRADLLREPYLFVTSPFVEGDSLLVLVHKFAQRGRSAETFNNLASTFLDTYGFFRADVPAGRTLHTWPRHPRNLAEEELWDLCGVHGSVLFLGFDEDAATLLPDLPARWLSELHEWIAEAGED